MTNKFLKFLVEKFGEETFQTDGKVIICKKCASKITIIGKKQYPIRQHIETQKHKKNLDLNKKKQLQNQTIIKINNSVSKFSSDLCFVSLSCFFL